MGTLWRSCSLLWEVAMRLFPNYFGISCYYYYPHWWQPMWGRSSVASVNLCVCPSVCLSAFPHCKRNMALWRKTAEEEPVNSRSAGKWPLKCLVATLGCDSSVTLFLWWLFFFHFLWVFSETPALYTNYLFTTKISVLFTMPWPQTSLNCMLVLFVNK